jgi:hypothetical protein
LDLGQIIDTIAFSPDGRLIATGHHDKPVCLWDAVTGDFVHELKGQDAVIWTVTFSPDGQWLASGGTDGTVQLWEVASGMVVLLRPGHEFWVMSLAFSPDGRTLASGGYDGVSYLWDLRPQNPKPEPLPAGGEPLWKALGDEESARAYRLIWALADHPAKALPALKGHLRPAGSKTDKERVGRLIAELDSDGFAQREAASQELAKLGDAVEPALREALAKATSLEARRRLQGILGDLRRERSTDKLRQLRALRVLELIANDEAVTLLRALADDPGGSTVPRQAKAALRRLGR